MKDLPQIQKKEEVTIKDLYDMPIGCLIWKKANDNPAILPFADVATKLSRTSYHMFINK